MIRLCRTLKKYILLTMMFSLIIVSTENIKANETTKAVENTQKTENKTENKTEKTLPEKVAKFVGEKSQITNITLESKKAIKIEWQSNPSADGYIIYRKTGGESFRRIKKITDRNSNSFIDKKVQYGNKYTYTIKAFIKYNNKNYYSNFDKKGTTKKLKVKKKYSKGYAYLYDMDNNQIKNVQAFLKNKDYCLKVNLTQNVLTIYARDGKKGYRIPVKAYLCSGNTNDKTGTFTLGVKYRYRTLFYNSYSQWSSRIYGNILFHTVPYKKSQNPNSLDVKQYNLLGTSASHGCIRLQCVATKWINENCKSGTKVVMYKSKNPGALGKPALEKIPSWHKWDPTDPTMKYKCIKRGCVHKEV